MLHVSISVASLIQKKTKHFEKNLSNDSGVSIAAKLARFSTNLWLEVMREEEEGFAIRLFRMGWGESMTVAGLPAPPNPPWSDLLQKLNSELSLLLLPLAEGLVVSRRCPVNSNPMGN